MSLPIPSNSHHLNQQGNQPTNPPDEKEKDHDGEVPDMNNDPDEEEHIENEEEFPPKNPKDAKIFAMLGGPGLGKSVLIKSLLYDYDKANFFKFGLVFTKTKFNSDYDFMPDDRVHSNFTVKKLEKYITRMKDWRENNGGKQCQPNFIIFDDLLGVINWYDPFMSNWLITFRHTNTSVFLVSQQMGKGTSTQLRQCINWAFMFRTEYYDEQKYLFHAFGQGFKEDDKAKLHLFTKVLMETTLKPYTCLVFKNKALGGIDESYRSYKAKEAPKDWKMVFKFNKSNSK